MHYPMLLRNMSGEVLLMKYTKNLVSLLVICLMLLVIAVHFDTFFHTLDICSFHVSL